MKFTVLAIGSALIGASLAAKAADNAQDIINSMPDCIKNCFGEALKDNDCGTKDLDCACSKYAPVTKSVSECISAHTLTGDCSIDDIKTLKSAGSRLCTDFTSDDLDNLKDELSSIADISTVIPGLPTITDIPNLTSALDSITAIATPTSSSSDDGDDGDDSHSNSQGASVPPNAGPRATPIAWAGAAIALAAIAL